MTFNFFLCDNLGQNGTCEVLASLGILDGKKLSSLNHLMEGFKVTNSPVAVLYNRRLAYFFMTIGFSASGALAAVLFFWANLFSPLGVSCP